MARGLVLSILNVQGEQERRTTRIVAARYRVSTRALPAFTLALALDGCGGSSNTTPQMVESVIYSFAGGSDGADPQGSLIQASDGNLYGTTSSGGAYDQGTVFKITPAGMETVLYSFAGGADGAGPVASLIQGSDGNLYGATPNGGANAYGTVFMITLTGTELVLHSFANGADGANPRGGLIQATDGNLYGTTASGGTTGGGTVFKITPAGIETVVYSFAGASAHDGYGPWAGLIQAMDGNLYGTTYAGGGGAGVAFSIAPMGGESVLASLAGGNDTAPFGSLVQAADGNFYGMSSGGVATVGLGVINDGTIFRITPGGVETVLHSFSGGPSDGAGPSASLIQSNDGSLYGMTGGGGEAGLGVVFKITLAGVETVLYSFAHGADGARPMGSLLQANNGHLYGVTSGGGANGYGTVFQIN